MVHLSIMEHATEAPAGAVVDVPHPNEQARRRFGRRTQFPAGALVWTSQAVAGARLSFELEEHVGWLAPDADDPASLDVVKQVSFLHKSADYDLDRFRRHYRHHVEVARRHMHTLWQYVQYDVRDITGADAAIASGIVAVSVLWFRATDDFLERYFASPEDQVAFQAEEGFLDLPKAFSFVVTSHPSAGPAARPRP
jgi:hypothetical protein